ncbi:MAG: acyltransferase [Cyclobacteriaceae bacterium]|nr:acyltransferase [Cyclobacteriaceae bacterium]
MGKYIKSLQGIRIIGIFFIMCHHYLMMNDVNWTVLGFTWIWVQMFFVQSSFLITTILLNDKGQPFKEYISDFYLRRFLRIVPLYFAYLLIFAVAYMIWGKPDDFGDRAPYLFSFTFNFTRLIPTMDYGSVWFVHLWSLSIEGQFYLIWPLVIYFLSQQQLKYVLGGIIILAPIFRYWLAGYLLNHGYSTEMSGEITYAFTLSQFDAFAWGAAIPVFNLQETLRKPGRWVLVSLTLLLAFGLANYFRLSAAGVDISITSFGFPTSWIQNFQHVWSYTLVNMLFMFAILYLVKENIKGIFSTPFFNSIGRTVYGIYVFHFAVLFAMTRLNMRVYTNPYLWFVVGIILTTMIAFISYNFYEKRIMELKDK